MFNSLYHNATPFERVKYGVCNIHNDPKVSSTSVVANNPMLTPCQGVRSAYGYGDRCEHRTLASMLGTDGTVATFTCRTRAFAQPLLPKILAVAARSSQRQSFNVWMFADKGCVCRCEYYAHVLVSFTDQELKDVHAVAMGEKRCIDNPTGTGSYKEIQVHGPLRLDRDIKAVIVNPKHKGDKNIKAMLDQFAEQNNCHIICE